MFEQILSYTRPIYFTVQARPLEHHCYPVEGIYVHQPNSYPYLGVKTRATLTREKLDSTPCLTMTTIKWYFALVFD